jgi:hypothetical protein
MEYYIRFHGKNNIFHFKYLPQHNFQLLNNHSIVKKKIVNIFSQHGNRRKFVLIYRLVAMEKYV